MDCDLARHLLDYARPAELEANDVAALERHLASCPDCGPRVGAERAFDASVARAMFAVPLPEGAGARLRTRLVAARMAWWRRTLLRAATVSVAAALVCSVALHYSRPTIDAAAVIRNAYELTGPGHGNDETRDNVTAWLRSFDAALVAPAEFNYKWLAFPEQSDFQGLHSVPTLVFTHGDATMRVYVVRERAFRNLSSLAAQPVEDFGCRIEARRYAEMPGWVFVVVTAGAQPNTFHRPQLMGGPA